MKNKLPNFLIVGAAKSGTSSLHNYLNQHPEVFMPSYDKNKMKVKEPRFLIKDLAASFPEAVIIGADVVKEPFYRLAKTLPGIPLIRFH